IFTESKDEYALVLFGSENTHLRVCEGDFTNIYFHNDDVTTANIDMLKVLENEVGTNMKTTGDFLNALIVAIEFLKVQCDGLDVKELTGKTIILLSNLAGVFNQVDQETLTSIISGLRLLDIDLIVIGPNLTEEPETQEQSQGVDAIKEIVEKASGSSYTFHDALNNLKFFAPKKTQARGQPFNFEIGQDVFIPMQMYVKNSEFSTKMSFETVSKQTNENLHKIRQYRKVGDGTEDVLDEIDEENGNGLPKTTAKIVDKVDIVKGYRYGSTLVAFSGIDMEMSSIKKEGKQLQLLSFTNRENVSQLWILYF
uniref:Uncharacterized protein n=1 Tax=Acrobeloides nanus TaxID=290746 RepID=A0A914D9H0_9BILA